MPNSVSNEENMFTNAMIKVNDFVVEDVVMGNIETGEKIPLDTYLRRLKLFSRKKELEGRLYGFAVDENNCVIAHDINVYRRQFFMPRIRKIFNESHVLQYRIFEEENLSKKIENEDTFYDGIFDLFQKVLAVQGFEDIKIYTMSDYDAELVARFVAAIKLMNLQPGKKVSRWLARVRDKAAFTRDMTKRKWSTLYLDDNNTNGLRYKLTVLSAFRFYAYKNEKCFTQKLLCYYRQNESVNQLTE